MDEKEVNIYFIWPRKSPIGSLPVSLLNIPTIPYAKRQVEQPLEIRWLIKIWTFILVPYD